MNMKRKNPNKAITEATTTIEYAGVKPEVLPLLHAVLDSKHVCGERMADDIDGLMKGYRDCCPILASIVSSSLVADGTYTVKIRLVAWKDKYIKLDRSDPASKFGGRYVGTYVCPESVLQAIHEALGIFHDRATISQEE